MKGGFANRSVAIAVGAKTQINGTNPAGTSGFFVSDTGENVSAGQYLDFTAALAVSGAFVGAGVSDYAIKAKGDVSVTGNLEVIGNVGITGDVEVIGDLGVTGDLDLVGKGRIFQNTLTTVGTLPIASGSISMATVFTIVPLDYDIVLYLSSENPYSKTLVAGIYEVQIVLGTNIVYFNRRGSDNPGTTATQRLQNLILNASVIVPAGVIAKVERATNSVNLPGFPYNIGVNYHKIGR
jgi:hypothetical protein